MLGNPQYRTADVPLTGGTRGPGFRTPGQHQGEGNWANFEKVRLVEG